MDMAGKKISQENNAILSADRNMILEKLYKSQGRRYTRKYLMYNV